MAITILAPAATDAASSTPALGTRPRHRQPNCKLVFSGHVASRIDPGKGILIVDEEKLIFENPDTKITITVDYPTIQIHAISRGPADPVVTAPCIYCQLDGGALVDERPPELRQPSDATAGSSQNGNGVARAGEKRPAEEELEREEAEEEATAEMRIVPDDPASLDAIYQALSECAALHPDPDFEDEDDDGDMMYTAEDAAELSEIGQAALQHIEQAFDVAPGATFTFNAGDLQLVAGAGFIGGPHVATGSETRADGQFEDAEEEERLER
ncbi:hypothetical protein HDU96_006092 [Phlyctochytrium bullatum]|nr:hypothetical protein HDU96_006092 [Phlyctochytrium bullatum]